MAKVTEVSGVFETDKLFSGGAGLFIEYTDLIRLTGLAVIMKLIHVQNFGFPTFMLEPLNDKSLVEWYMNRSHINPLVSLDYKQKLSPEEADKHYLQILSSDPELYQIAPSSNIDKLFHVLRRTKSNTPVFIYHDKYDKDIEADIKKNFSFAKFVYGNLERYLNNNYTYIFSKISTLQYFLSISQKIWCHVIMSTDFDYNFLTKPVYEYDQSMIRLSGFSYIHNESIVKWISDLKKILKGDVKL